MSKNTDTWNNKWKDKFDGLYLENAWLNYKIKRLLTYLSNKDNETKKNI